LANPKGFENFGVVKIMQTNSSGTVSAEN